MNFKLNIGTLTETINEYDNLINILSEQMANIDNTLTELTEAGWSGESRDSFIELHKKNAAMYAELQEEVKYMKWALENEEKPRALQLKTRSEDFVNCIKRNSQGAVNTCNDKGMIVLNGGQFSINHNINNCTSDYYCRIKKGFDRINSIIEGLEYTSFGIGGDVYTGEMSVKNQTISLTDFNESFNIYCRDIESMESNICYVLSRISGVSDTSNFDAGSIIPASGEIDKNKLKELCRTGWDDLSKDEKAFLEYAKLILGEEIYNEFIQKEIELTKGPTPEEAAEMAADVYGTVLTLGGDKTLAGGWKLAEEPYVKGGLEINVYERKRIDGTIEYVIANAGTEFTSLSDWKNNFQQIIGKSYDVKNSLKYVESIIRKHPKNHITCVGHSKGGAEAAINAVKYNLDAIVFNPATANLKAYGADVENYIGDMTTYIVKGEILNKVEGIFSKPIDEVVYLPTQHRVHTGSKLLNLVNSINNHSMSSVKDGLEDMEDIN